jgi:hypothetical protein
MTAPLALANAHRRDPAATGHRIGTFSDALAVAAMDGVRPSPRRASGRGRR